MIAKLDLDMVPQINNKHHALERGAVTEVILNILAGGGLLAMMVIAPNAIQALPFFIPELRRKQYVQTTLGRLLAKKLVARQQTGTGKTYFKLTSSGRDLLKRYQLKKLQIKIPRRWDQKWRLVIFDIKELRRVDRDLFRRQLKEFGFAKLQNSVWVFPYECGELIELLKSSYRLGKNVIYLRTDKIQGDSELREKFDLLS